MAAGSTAAAASALQSLIYTPATAGNGGNGPTLTVLDQLLIPREKAYIEVKSIQDAWQVWVRSGWVLELAVVVIAPVGADRPRMRPPNDSLLPSILPSHLLYT